MRGATSACPWNSHWRPHDYCPRILRSELQMIVSTMTVWQRDAHRRMLMKLPVRCHIMLGPDKRSGKPTITNEMVKEWEVLYANGKGATLGEIAERYGVVKSTVGSRLYRARHRRGETLEAVKLTEEIVRAIRKRDRSAAAWAKELGLDLRSINRARSGRTWSHVK